VIKPRPIMVMNRFNQSNTLKKLFGGVQLPLG
jgi:hypothetical protein